MQISHKRIANKEPEEYFEEVKMLKVPKGAGFGQNRSGWFGIPTPGPTIALALGQGTDVV